MVLNSNEISKKYLLCLTCSEYAEYDMVSNSDLARFRVTTGRPKRSIVKSDCSIRP